jgi:hypothetical protein
MVQTHIFVVILEKFKEPVGAILVALCWEAKRFFDDDDILVFEVYNRAHLTTPHGTNDLDLVALVENLLAILGSGSDSAIYCYGYPMSG